ncbi:MAG: GAF domain-containing protein [Pseudonocardiaceae bacterium]
MEARSTPSAWRLLDATLEVTSGVNLTDVLHHLLDAARRLVDAEYAAVGIVSRGHPVRFVHTGMDAETVARIAHPPEAKGVLGRLMRSALRVPITTRAEVFGNLYITQKRDGTEFSAEDQELAAALASAAGVAIDNAELFKETQRRQAWQRATTDITTLLLSGQDLQDILAVLARHARRLGDAAAAAITVPTEDPGLLRVAAGTGMLDQRLVGEFFPAEGSISQRALTSRSAIVVDDIAAGTHTSAAGALGIGPAVAVRLGAETADGVLLVARTTEEPAFASQDVTMIASFAGHVGLALNLADDRRKRELEHLVEDRERIAAHLSEHAMQALLGISTTVHGLTARMQSRDDAQRLTEQVDRLDAVLREMQRAIFGLHLADRATPDGAGAVTQALSVTGGSPSVTPHPPC